MTISLQIILISILEAWFLRRFQVLGEKSLSIFIQILVHFR